MSPDHNQVKFRCSDRFLQRIKSECIKREMSAQDLITNALKFYFQTGADDWKEADLMVLSGSDEETNRIDLWVKYMNKMPPEKVQLIEEVLKLDLQHYASSRRKADLRKRQARSKRGANANVETRTE